MTKPLKIWKRNIKYEYEKLNMNHNARIGIISADLQYLLCKTLEHKD